MAQIHNLQNMVLDAVEVVEFRLVRSRDDFDNSLKFPPGMAHQIFGENETIFGYKDLKVDIMYTAGPLQIYIDMKYSSKVDDLPNVEDIKADDVIGTIASKLPDGCYFTNLDEFLKTLDKGENFQPFGEKIREYQTVDKEGNQRHFEFYHCDHTTPKFTAFFSRLQTFVLWFVDAASYIDVDDPQWTYFVCYEKYKNADGNYQYATVGYSTVYQYYAYPEHIRPRISQMLILPPFQKLGIGTKFIDTIYTHFLAEKNVIDITVEDPSDDFRRIRNFVDARLCQDLPSFAKEVIKNGFTKDMIKEAREKIKINPKQTRIIYEIIRLFHTNIHNERDYRNYRLEVKKRLNSVHYKQLCDIAKLEKAKMDANFLKATLPSKELRLEQLNEEYEEIEEEYLKIVEKLKHSE